jgi:hypothetical protein
MLDVTLKIDLWPLKKASRAKNTQELFVSQGHSLLKDGNNPDFKPPKHAIDCHPRNIEIRTRKIGAEGRLRCQSSLPAHKAGGNHPRMKQSRNLRPNAANCQQRRQKGQSSVSRIPPTAPLFR